MKHTTVPWMFLKGTGSSLTQILKKQRGTVISGIFRWENKVFGTTSLGAIYLFIAFCMLLFSMIFYIVYW